MEIFTIACILFITSFNADSCDALIGGEDATISEFPYIVSLRNIFDAHYCGGALVTRRHVVTAAQCLYTDESVFGKRESKFKTEDVQVLIGAVHSDISNMTTSQRAKSIFTVKKFSPHPKYRITDINTTAYDIAIITLEKDVHIDKVNPIEISKLAVVPKTIGIVAGWGIKYMKDILTFTTANVLQKLTFTISPIQDCKKLYSVGKFSAISKSLDDKSIYCALSPRKGSGSCLRDSGSPMVSNGVLTGILSFGFPCATGRPDYFVSAAYHKDFIYEQIK